MHLLKREAQRLLEKSAHPPSFKSHLKISGHLLQLLAITPNCQYRTQVFQRPFIYYIQLLATELWTNWNLSKWRNEHFKPRMLLFSVGNGAMNAPRYWQRGRDACTMWRLRDETGAITPRFFYFLKTPVPLPLIKIFRMRPLLARSISLDNTFNKRKFLLFSPC